MTDKEKYEKPDLAQLGDDRDELPVKDLDQVSGGNVEGSNLCIAGSQTVTCQAGGDVHHPIV